MGKQRGDRVVYLAVVGLTIVAVYGVRGVLRTLRLDEAQRRQDAARRPWAERA